MKTIVKNQHFIGILAFALLLVGMIGISFMQNEVRQADASTVVGNDYQSRIATSTSAATNTPLTFIGGSLGSVIIASTSPITTVGPMIAFYDTASTTQSTTTMRQIAVLGASGGVTPPAGTYTFDIATAKGLMMWVNPAFNGTYVVTYR